MDRKFDFIKALFEFIIPAVLTSFNRLEFGLGSALISGPYKLVNSFIDLEVLNVISA